MRRNEIKTGELVAWARGRDDDSRPGFTVGPIPVTARYNGDYLRTRGDRGNNYLVLIPTSGARATASDHHEKLINAAVEDGRTEPGADFWGLGTALLDYVKLAATTLEETGQINSDGIPDGWSWEIVTASLLRGPYPPHRIEENKRRAEAQRVQYERDQVRQANGDRLARIKKRLVGRDLPSGFSDRVDFVGFKPAEKNPLVAVPLSLLELLLDDGER